MSLPRQIAVIDIGKTNAKVVLIDTVRQKSAPLAEAMRRMVRQPWRDG